MDYNTLTNVLSERLGIDTNIFKIDLDKEKMFNEDYSIKYYSSHVINTYHISSYSYKENIKEHWESVTLIVPHAIIGDYINVMDNLFIESGIAYDFSDASNGFTYDTENFTLLNCTINKDSGSYSLEIALKQ